MSPTSQNELIVIVAKCIIQKRLFLLRKLPVYMCTVCIYVCICAFVLAFVYIYIYSYIYIYVIYIYIHTYIYIYILLKEQWWLLVLLKTTLTSDTSGLQMFLISCEKRGRHKHYQQVLSHLSAVFTCSFGPILFIHTKTIYKHS